MITIIGAGLAGCEAAHVLSSFSIPCTLIDMKPKKFSPAHQYPGLCELVCSNSLKAMRIDSAAGLLKEEMRRLGSLTMEAADQTVVPAGGALAVDREKFSDYITAKIKRDPNITLVCEEVLEIPKGDVLIATGPLTAEGLSHSIQTFLGQEYLSFFDAAAPIITAESIDFEKVFFAARYDRGEKDYINCPFDKEPYLEFVEALRTAQRAPLADFDVQNPKVYEGCMPVEVLASRGTDTLRFGPMKPVGLTDPHTGRRPYAAVQLRAENAEKRLYNLVGFQTNLKFPEQKRVFSMIPGLEHAEFARYGVMHRNTFLCSPKLLDKYQQYKNDKRILFAGQITGVEGYIESAASGILAGMNLANKVLGKPLFCPVPSTMLGALMYYISDETVEKFQPMGCAMGLLPPLNERIRDKKLRYEALSRRSLSFYEENL